MDKINNFNLIYTAILDYFISRNSFEREVWELRLVAGMECELISDYFV